MSDKNNLPPAYNGCKCICHREPGVMHMFPCCYPTREFNITKQEKAEYRAYLTGCTDRQVLGCYDKEKEAGREDYVALCELEMARRGLTNYD